MNVCISCVFVLAMGEVVTVNVSSAKVERGVLLEEGSVGRIVSLVLLGSVEPELQDRDQLLSVAGEKFSNREELLRALQEQKSGSFEAKVRRQQVITVRIKKVAGQPLGLGCKEDKAKGHVYVTSLSGVCDKSGLQADDQIV